MRTYSYATWQSASHLIPRALNRDVRWTTVSAQKYWPYAQHQVFQTCGLVVFVASVPRMARSPLLAKQNASLSAANELLGMLKLLLLCEGTQKIYFPPSRF